MRRYIVAALVVLWALFWANDTGVLILSRQDADYQSWRTCHYLIGLTIVRLSSTPDRPIYRCPLLSRV